MTPERFTVMTHTVATIAQLLRTTLGDEDSPNTCIFLANALAQESGEIEMMGPLVRLKHGLAPAFHDGAMREFLQALDRRVGGINAFCAQHGLRVPAVLRDILPAIHERHTE